MNGNVVMSGMLANLLRAAGATIEAQRGTDSKKVSSLRDISVPELLACESLYEPLSYPDGVFGVDSTGKYLLSSIRNCIFDQILSGTADAYVFLAHGVADFFASRISEFANLLMSEDYTQGGAFEFVPFEPAKELSVFRDSVGANDTRAYVFGCTANGIPLTRLQMEQPNFDRDPAGKYFVGTNTSQPIILFVQNYAGFAGVANAPCGITAWDNGRGFSLVVKDATKPAALAMQHFLRLAFKVFETDEASLFSSATFAFNCDGFNFRFCEPYGNSVRCLEYCVERIDGLDEPDFCDGYITSVPTEGGLVRTYVHDYNALAKVLNSAYQTYPNTFAPMLTSVKYMQAHSDVYGEQLSGTVFVPKKQSQSVMPDKPRTVVQVKRVRVTKRGSTPRT